MADERANRVRAGLIVVAASFAAIAAALAFGSVAIAPRAWFAALAGGGDPTHVEIVWGLRAPRAFAAFATGALLALAGTLLQALLRNPLADPYVLGVSGGAGLGAMLAILLGAGAAAMTGYAVAGAALAALFLFALTFRRAGWDPYRLLLAGVALASACGALSSVILVLAPAVQLPGMLFWLMGDLGGAIDARPAWVVLGATLAAALAIAGPLDALALGEAKARTLGVAVTRVQAIALGAATLATAAAVVLAGSVGFVGLVAPHLLRLAGHHRHRALIPLAVLAGGTLVTVADTVARTVARPVELPVGAITALVGVPMLLYLLLRSR